MSGQIHRTRAAAQYPLYCRSRIGFSAPSCPSLLGCQKRRFGPELKDLKTLGLGIPVTRRKLLAWDAASVSLMAVPAQSCVYSTNFNIFRPEVRNLYGFPRLIKSQEHADFFD